MVSRAKRTVGVRVGAVDALRTKFPAQAQAQAPALAQPLLEVAAAREEAGDAAVAQLQAQISAL